MGLITTNVDICINGTTYKYYESLGYIIPKRMNQKGELKLDTLKPVNIKVEDLPTGSHTLVEVECDNDNCRHVANIAYRDYIKYINKHG